MVTLAAAANRIASWSTSQFAVAVTNYIAFSYDENEARRLPRFYRHFVAFFYLIFLFLLVIIVNSADFNGL